MGGARPNRKVTGDHGDAARPLRGEEGGTEGWGRLVSGGAGERGAGEQRRQVGPGAQGERATRGVTRADWGAGWAGGARALKRGRALLAAGPCGAIVSWAERIAGQGKRELGLG